MSDETTRYPIQRLPLTLPLNLPQVLRATTRIRTIILTHKILILPTPSLTHIKTVIIPNQLNITALPAQNQGEEDLTTPDPTTTSTSTTPTAINHLTIFTQMDLHPVITTILTLTNGRRITQSLLKHSHPPLRARRSIHIRNCTIYSPCTFQKNILNSSYSTPSSPLRLLPWRNLLCQNPN